MSMCVCVMTFHRSCRESARVIIMLYNIIMSAFVVCGIRVVLHSVWPLLRLEVSLHSCIVQSNNSKYTMERQ